MNVHSTAMYHNTDELDCLFAEWCELDTIAANSYYNDEKKADRANAALDAYEEAKRRNRKQTKRLVAIGDETGVTAVAQEWQEQLEAERDYLGTVEDASIYGQM